MGTVEEPTVVWVVVKVLPLLGCLTLAAGAPRIAEVITAVSTRVPVGVVEVSTKSSIE